MARYGAMQGYDAMQEEFEEVMVLGRPALFTGVRIERDTVPEGLYLYEVRGNDNGGDDTVQIAKGIPVNCMVPHFGSIITRELLDLPPDGYFNSGPEKGWNFADGNCRTVKGFQEKTHVEEPTLTESKKIENTAITKGLMRIDTRRQVIDIQQIANRRFMYNPKIGILVLGYQYETTKKVISSHANELAEAGITKGYDDFVRGWIGTSREYPKGVIHFAPCMDKRNIKLFNRAFDTLIMFQENGALENTVVRGFGENWEQPLSDIFTDMREPEQKS